MSYFTLARMILLAPLLCCACAGMPRGGFPVLFTLDTVSNACVRSPGTCAAMAEKEGVSLRFLLKTAAVAGAGTAAVLALDAKLQAKVEEALVECAEQARSEVLFQNMKGRIPTPEECKEVIAMTPRGEPITRAMQLGDEMHRLALQCVQERLSKLRPGGFSLEPRYRYNLKTREKTLITPEEEQRLLREGRYDELRGTLVPDVVLHKGDPLQVEAVYDFKFPCFTSIDPPNWRQYPKGHPYDKFSQGDVYEMALQGKPPARVAPRWGIIR